MKESLVDGLKGFGAGAARFKPPETRGTLVTDSNTVKLFVVSEVKLPKASLAWTSRWTSAEETSGAIHSQLKSSVSG